MKTQPTKLQLISTPDGDVLVSDRPITGINTPFLDTITNEIYFSLKDEEFLRHEKRIEAQSPGMKLPNVPVYNPNEEIEKLADEYAYGNNLPTPTSPRHQRYEGFIKGRKSSPYKYTEEDMRKAFNYFKYAPFPHNEGCLTFEEFIQSLTQLWTDGTVIEGKLNVWKGQRV